MNYEMEIWDVIGQRIRDVMFDQFKIRVRCELSQPLGEAPYIIVVYRDFYRRFLRIFLVPGER